MKKVFELKGYLQQYAWGGTHFIPNLLGFDVDNHPYAEYWLGAHSNAPAIVRTVKGDIPLDELIASRPKEFLGERVAEQFGRLPYLFKILDVYEMLSIQVHPTKSEAVKGFIRENELNIPVSAPQRNYKDDNHKPEIMVALGEFWLLHGFLPKQELMEVLQSTAEFNNLIPVFEKHGYKGLYRYVMELPADASDAILKPIANRVLPLFHAHKLSKVSPDYWAAKAFANFGVEGPLDKGIFSIYFFNIVKVEKGEAVFQDAGIPHAYLEGQNIELMANSDNVLRGGLTLKHVDVAELLDHVIFEETVPEILTGVKDQDGKIKTYKSPAPDFELSCIHLDGKQRVSLQSKSLEIFFVLSGKALVSQGDTSLISKKGEAFLVMASADITISSLHGATIYRATIP